MQQVSVVDLVAAVVAGTGEVIDVRERHEFVAGHIPGAVHVPLHLVPLREADFRGSRPIYVICESGARSWQAATYLDRAGISVNNVQGGMTAWRGAGLAVATGEPAATDW